MQIIDRPSPNFNDRRITPAPTHLILHYTGMESADAALDRLCDPAAEVSAHYVVDDTGVIYKLVAEDKRAWHAGVSSWHGLTDLNSRSIGIEMVNRGFRDERHTHPFPPAQMAAVTALCQDIIKRHPIPPAQILGHSDIAPGRKRDPGELFDWQGLAAAGVGLWPEKGGDTTGDPRTLLTRYGYDTTAALPDVLTAFQRHFHPEIFQEPEKVGMADPETMRRLNSLLSLSPLGEGRGPA